MQMTEWRYQMGVTLRDKITGFEGVVVGRADYHTGCRHYALQTRTLKDGAIPEWEYLDETRLELVAGTALDLGPAEGPGGPMPKFPQV